jgi:hypothetical protein
VKHLAIFRNGEDQLIFSGEKTIDARFSKKKVAPFGVVSVGDIVYIKPSGKDISGQFRVKKVIFIDGLDLSSLSLLSDLGIKKTPEDAKYVTLIFIGQVEQFLTSPIKIPKKDQKGWVVLD